MERKRGNRHSIQFLKCVLYFSLVSISSIVTLSAQTKLDSAYAIWQNQNEPDSARFKAYNIYIWNGILFSDTDSAYALAQILIDSAIESNYTRGKTFGLNIQATALQLQGKTPEALELYLESLSISEELKDKESTAATFNYVGLAYASQSEHAQALDYYGRSLAISEERGNKKGIATSLHNIGSIYTEQGDYPKALEYYLRGLSISEKLNDKKGIASTSNNIGNIYSYRADYDNALKYFSRTLRIGEEINDQHITSSGLMNCGIMYRRKGEYTKALTYLERSLKLSQKLGSKVSIARTLGNIGNIHNDLTNYEKALEYYRRSLELKEEISEKVGMANTLTNIGLLYQKMAKVQEGIKACEKAYVLSQETAALNEEKSACECLYKGYKILGDGSKALEYHEKLWIVDDSLSADETSRNLQQMEFKKTLLRDSIRRTEEDRLIQQAHQTEIDDKNRIRNLAVAAGGFFIILALAIYARLRFTRNAKEAIEKEKDISDSLLLNILPAEVAEELKTKGRADAKGFDTVSIIFTDFKEFTKTSEQLSAQDLVSEISTCFEAFDHIMTKHGIEKIKTIGDAYMAASGLPIPNDTAVKGAVLAALEMQAFITQRKQEKDGLGEVAFEMRVGIHTGPVVAGIVGVKKFQYDVWGDTVNTAARMESHGKVGRVNISNTTYELLKHEEFTFEERQELEVKGKGKMKMWFVAINE